MGSPGHPNSPGAGADAVPGGAGRRARSLVYLLLFIAFVDNFAMLPTVAPYAQQVGARLTGIGVAVAAYSLTNLVFNVVGGAVLDRVGRRRVVVASLCMVSAATLCYPLVSTLGGLVVVRLLHGVGGGILVPAIFTVLGDLAPAVGPGRAMGRAGAVIGAAAVVAPAMAGGVRQVAGFTAVFLAVAATTALGALLAAALLAETGAARHRSSSRRSIRALLRRPQLQAACLTAFVFTGAVGTLAAFLPGHVEALGMGPGATGGLFTLFALMAIGVMLSRVAGTVEVRGVVAPAVAGLAVLTASLLALSGQPSPLPTAGAVALFGVGYGLVFPAMAGVVGLAAGPAERGTAYGLFMAFFSLGFVVVPPAGGVVGDTSPLGPFAVAAVVCAVGAAVITHRRSLLRPAPRA